MYVYVSGALMGSRDLMTARQNYEFAAECIEDIGHRAYVPHLHTDPVLDPSKTPSQVFETDLRQLKQADLIVAFLDEPSLGVGAELALASEAKIPVLGLHRQGATVSRFVTGLLLSSGNTVRTYASGNDIRDAIARTICRAEAFTA